MTFMKHVGLAAALLSSAAVQASLYGESNVNHTCVLEPSILSCSSQANPANVDSCCTETYGGLVLSTQFWQTWTGLESKGQKLPPNRWTLHGLWPDFCNGSYTQYCDLSRQYDPVPSPNTTNGLPNGTVVPPYDGPNVGTFLEAFGRYDLLKWMNTYWVNQGAPNTDFWAHEFSKHATCFSTFDLPCYGPEYVKHQEVVEFFETAIKYYNRLPTWEWLNEAKIVPSNSTTYTLSDLQAALTQKYGATPYIGCSGPRYNTTEAGKDSSDNGRTVISEVWYYSHVIGRPQDGNSIPVNATGSNTSCAKAKGALHYYEMTPESVQGH
ncbi:ribonuclease T2, partial [Aureobasidium melanogenum]